MKKVLVFGTFDFLHPGHIRFFTQAKALGDHLTVVIARDSTAAKVKKRKPTLSEQARLDLVRSVAAVDHAILGDKDDVYSCLKKVRPNVIALGYDQHRFTGSLPQKLKSLGLKTRIKRLKSLKPEKFKSSKVKKITEKNDAKVFLVPLAIIIKDGKVFLQQRNDPGTINHKKWEFPGGSVEWGETPEQCLVREVKEETGYDVVAEKLLPKIFTNYRTYQWGRVQIVLMPYICRLTSSVLKISDREVLRTGWFTIAQAIRKPLLPKNKQMLRITKRIQNL